MMLIMNGGIQKGGHRYASVFAGCPVDDLPLLLYPSERFEIANLLLHWVRA
jgi:hypothetical protein